MTSKIAKSKKFKVIGGVCSGIALSKGWSLSLTRLASLMIIFTTGFGLILYILFWIFLPQWSLAGKGPEPDSLPMDSLTRNPRNRILGGVCGGIAEFFDIDAALVRIGWALLILLFGVGIIPYFYAYFVLPLKKTEAIASF